jgi:hypothetical protein
LRDSRLDSVKKRTEMTMKMRKGEGELQADSGVGPGLRFGAREA